MELRHLRYFVAVAEHLHFGRAAARLHVAQPALSRQIRQLEDEIGTDLFDRASRGVELTAAGCQFLEGARETLAAADRALQGARQAFGKAVGRISVAFVTTILDSPQAGAILRRFRVRHPDVRVEVRALQTVEQREALGHGGVQVGFLYAPPEDPGIRSEPLFRQEILLALPSGHPLARGGGPVPLALAAREPFLWFDREAAPYPHDLVRRKLEAHGLSMRAFDQAASEEARLSLVAGGMGLTLVPGTPGLPTKPGIELRRVPELDSGAQVYVAFRHKPAPIVEAFLAEVRATFAETEPMLLRSGTLA